MCSSLEQATIHILQPVNGSMTVLNPLASICQLCIHPAVAVIAQVRSDMGYGSGFLHQAKPFIAFQVIDLLATENVRLGMEIGRLRALRDLPSSRHNAFMSLATVPSVWRMSRLLLTDIERSAIHSDYLRAAGCSLLLLTMYGNNSIQ